MLYICIKDQENDLLFLATISVKEEPPQENAEAESWSPLLSVGLQPSSAQTQLTQTVGICSSQVS